MDEVVTIVNVHMLRQQDQPTPSVSQDLRLRSGTEPISDMDVEKWKTANCCGDGPA